MGATKLKNTDNLFSNKYQKYNEMFERMSPFYLIASVVVYIVRYFIHTDGIGMFDKAALTKMFWVVGICLAFLLYKSIKFYIFKTKKIGNKYYSFFDNVIYLVLISFITVYANVGNWLLIAILQLIFVTCLTRGLQKGLLMLALSFGIHNLVYSLINIPKILRDELPLTQNYNNLFSIVVYFTMFLICTIFTGKINKDSIERDIQNLSLIEQLEEKYLQLELARDEINQQYEKLISTNDKLEETNNRLSKNIAEFYTLQQISQAIGSILDIKELLKYLNDIILGVMGVNYVTIILYDEGTDRLRVETTNIASKSERALVADNINNNTQLKSLNIGQSIMENEVDKEKYTFTKGRNVNSLICVPLNTKAGRFGLVLVEHTLTNAFDDESVRLLNIIAQQVGIVLENAELYNKMKELARTDGLTGTYNRQYFQELLSIEVKNAEQWNYTLSLAIFDIDHFKRFNDTFGHLFGDQVLVSIVNAVKAALRKHDIIARFGGEEFIILFPRTKLADAYDKAEELRKIIEKHIIKDNLVSVSVTVSFGVSSFQECALNENDLVRTADDALFEAKASGRNCVRTAKPLIPKRHNSI